MMAVLRLFAAAREAAGTGRADLGLVTDAPQLLVELAGRLAVPVPPEVKEVLPG